MLFSRFLSFKILGSLILLFVLSYDHCYWKDKGQEEKGATEDEMVRCHHQLKGHEFEQTPGDSEGQGGLAAVHGVRET